MANMDIIAPPQAATITVALEPAYNAINSLLVFAEPELLSQMGDWAVQTFEAMTPEQRRASDLIGGKLLSAILPEDKGWPDFPTYLESLAAENAETMRDRAIGHVCYSLAEDDVIDREALLADVDVYLKHMEDAYRRWGKHDKLEHVDWEVYKAAHVLLNDPPALKAQAVSYLRSMWETFLAPEWARVEPMLKESAMAFQKLDYTRLSTAEAFRTITGRILPEEFEKILLGTSDPIVFIPSAHMGPYVRVLTKEGTRRVTFGARIPEGVPVHSPDLSRAELLVRLSALADDTRLRILELLVNEGEQNAKTIMARLDLSQSATSRHLRQLRATGYIIGKRKEGGKYYQMNNNRADDTLNALVAFLKRK